MVISSFQRHKWYNYLQIFKPQCFPYKPNSLNIPLQLSGVINSATPEPATSTVAGPSQRPPQEQVQDNHLCGTRPEPATSTGSGTSKCLQGRRTKRPTRLQSNLREGKATYKNAEWSPGWLELWLRLYNEEQPSNHWIHWHLEDWSPEAQAQLQQWEGKKGREDKNILNSTGSNMSYQQKIVALKQQDLNAPL